MVSTSFIEVDLKKKSIVFAAFSILPLMLRNSGEDAMQAVRPHISTGLLHP